MSLVIYGHWLSQPSRAVGWLCLLGGVDFTFETIDVLSGENKKPEFRQKSPNGLVPALYDPRHDVRISEGHAMLQYICERENLTSWFPQEMKVRALVLQYLHWHHSNTRKLTLPLFHTFMEKKDPHCDAVKEDIEKVKPSLQQLNDYFLPEGDKFMCGTDEPTIADLTCYTEFDQVKKFNLMDLSSYPRIEQWIAKMEKLPHRDEAQKALNDIYDQVTSR